MHLNYLAIWLIVDKKNQWELGRTFGLNILVHSEKQKKNTKKQQNTKKISINFHIMFVETQTFINTSIFLNFIYRKSLMENVLSPEI